MTTRPLRFEDYVGQERIKQQLTITMGACARASRPLPHMLLTGNAGLGKTTLAKIIASEYRVGYHEVLASNLSSPTELQDLLADLPDNGNDIIFIDEIHRLPMRLEEMLYSPMEDFTISLPKEDGSMGQFWTPKFTLIGATTLAGDLSRPLRDRFGLHFQLQPYGEEDLASIIGRLAEREGFEITGKAKRAIASRSKGTARIAVRYFYRCKEYAEFVNASSRIDSAVALAQFAILGIDEIGLDENDYRVLTYLAGQRRPVGLDALASAVDIDKPTIANIIEPYLAQKGLVLRTNRGREITLDGLNWIRRNSMPDPEEVIQQQPSDSGRVERVSRHVSNSGV